MAARGAWAAAGDAGDRVSAPRIARANAAEECVPPSLKESGISEDRGVGAGLAPNIDLHDFIKRDATLAPVIELRGAGRPMRRHPAGLLEGAAVLKVGRDARAAEGVVADLR